MGYNQRMNKYAILLGGALIAVSLSGVAYADHSWGNYHWARTANPFTLQLGDGVKTTAWDASLNLASSDWSQSAVLDTTVVTSLVNPKNCKATAGRVEVCNSKYGRNGWLGLAQIWVSGGEHITQGVVKVNDTYFNTATYNKPEWRNLVMCQEIGHTFGLDHQDENFNNANLGTCMDYTNTPSTNQHPNAHDYEELESIYSHVDLFSTLKTSLTSSRGAKDVDVSEKSEWGREVRQDSAGNASLFRRDIGNGVEVFTFVTWAE